VPARHDPGARLPAAVRAKEIAFLISISGSGISAAEATIDQAHIDLMNLQYEFARTSHGWDEYAAARGQVAARMGTPPKTFPGTPGDPYWQFLRRSYSYDPAPTLQKLTVPVLALFGELDNNIVAEKNKSAWETALKLGNNQDYTLRILPKADHLQFEAKIGNNAEMASLQRFVPEYYSTIQDWLTKRIRGLRATYPSHTGVIGRQTALNSDHLNLCGCCFRPAWQRAFCFQAPP
jgi:pimeloyl-ACP methyl ester carboxylesterase